MDIPLDELSSDGRLRASGGDINSDSPADDRKRQAERQALLVGGLRRQTWFQVIVGIFGRLSGDSHRIAQNRVEGVVVPLWLQFESVSLLPDEQTVKSAFSISPPTNALPGRRRTKRGLHKQEALERREMEQRYMNELYTKMLPLSLSCASLTAFILPLYDGDVVYGLRWAMTLVSAIIGPRLQSGLYPLLGVLIFGLMVNRPLATCTLCLGAWAGVTLATVVARALGVEWE